MMLSEMEIPKKYMQSVIQNLDYNVGIGKYYWRLLQEFSADPDRTETEVFRVQSKLERLSSCNSFWLLDAYHVSKIKDFKKTNLCKDKFCNNCKKVKQASRQARFMPEITRYAHEYKMSHMVLTIPNVTDSAGEGVNLRKHIKIMFKAFANLVDYLKEKKKIKGVSFDIGYVGAIRSLEVTYKKNSYHPHLHVLIAHRDDLGDKQNTNSYSFDKYGKRPIREFSDFEVMIQKLWFLLINDILEVENSNGNQKRRKKITKQRLDSLDIGYSCMIDEFKENDFHELFKYMTKSDGIDKKEDENESSIMTYLNFKTLHFALASLRQIQGYGVFFNIGDDDEMMEAVVDLYEKEIAMLREKEKPETVSETVQALLADNEYTVVSKKQIYKILSSSSN